MSYPELEQPDKCTCGSEFVYNSVENLLICESCGRQK